MGKKGRGGFELLERCGTVSKYCCHHLRYCFERLQYTQNSSGARDRDCVSHALASQRQSGTARYRQRLPLAKMTGTGFFGITQAMHNDRFDRPSTSTTGKRDPTFCPPPPPRSPRVCFPLRLSHQMIRWVLGDSDHICFYDLRHRCRSFRGDNIIVATPSEHVQRSVDQPLVVDSLCGLGHLCWGRLLEGYLQCYCPNGNHGNRKINLALRIVFSGRNDTFSVILCFSSSGNAISRKKLGQNQSRAKSSRAQANTDIFTPVHQEALTSLTAVTSA